MMYHKQKLQEELELLESHYQELHDDWNQPKDREVLYKIRVPLIIVAFLLRTIGTQNIQVKILREIKSDESPRKLKYTNREVGEFVGSDNFQNKVEETYSLQKICNYLVHQSYSYFVDDMTNPQQKDGFRIYYCVDTDYQGEIFIDISEFIVTAQRRIANI